MPRLASIAVLATAAITVIAAVTGCGGAPAVAPPPPPLTVDAQLAATADVNPDAGQRPSPVVVRIYELADTEVFAAADFFAVWNQEQPTLAAALVRRHEFVLAPGGKSNKLLTLDPRVQALGVAAAYRDIRNASWRVVVPVVADPTGPRAFRLDINAAPRTVTAGLAPVTTAAGTSP